MSIPPGPKRTHGLENQVACQAWRRVRGDIPTKVVGTFGRKCGEWSSGRALCDRRPKPVRAPAPSDASISRAGATTCGIIVARWSSDRRNRERPCSTFVASCVRATSHLDGRPGGAPDRRVGDPSGRAGRHAPRYDSIMTRPDRGASGAGIADLFEAPESGLRCCAFCEEPCTDLICAACRERLREDWDDEQRIR